MEKRILIYITLSQIIFIIGVAINIHNKKVLGQQTVSSIIQQNINEFPSADLKYFYEPQPNSDGSESTTNALGLNAKYKINSESLNDRYDYEVIKPNNTYRIIALGDSFTFGLYIDTDKNWTELLEDQLNNELNCKNINKFEVINLGVGGYDNEYSLERFKRRGLKYEPDLVLWFQIDLVRYNEKLRPKFLEIERQAKLNSNKNTQSTNGKYYASFNKARSEVINELGEMNVVEYQIRSIEKIKDFYKGSLVLFSFDFQPLRYKKLLENTASAQKGWFYFQNLRNIYNMDGYLPDNHPNEKGHKIIGEDIFNYLKKSKLISC